MMRGLAHDVLHSCHENPTAGTHALMCHSSTIICDQPCQPGCLQTSAAWTLAFAGTSNLIRGICLALGATFLGCALTFTIPDAVANALNIAMPVWFYESEVSPGAARHVLSPSG